MAFPDADNTSPPTLSGSTKWGGTLNGDDGGWTGVPPPTLTRQWVRCTSLATASCVGIAGATTHTYILSGSDVGRRIRFRVTGDNAAGGPETAYSAATAIIVADPPDNTAAPTFFGRAREGATLTRSSFGSWRNPAATDYSHQWLRCNTAGAACTPIPGATADGYSLTSVDVGRRIRLRVRARGRYGTGQADSNASATVVAERALRLSPFPRIVVAGRVSRRGAVFTQVTVRGPRSLTVRIRCRGGRRRGCPWRRRSYRMRSRRLRIRALQRRFRSGAVIELRILKQGFIGKYTRIRIRRRRAPARVDRCLAPGASRPTRCGR